jgi:hypothetical protein
MMKACLIGDLAVIQPVPPDDSRSADEVMAEWLLLYEHSEEIQRRLKLLARQLSEHIAEAVRDEERRASKKSDTDSAP